MENKRATNCKLKILLLLIGVVVVVAYMRGQFHQVNRVKSRSRLKTIVRDNPRHRLPDREPDKTSWDHRSSPSQNTWDKDTGDFTKKEPFKTTLDDFAQQRKTWPDKTGKADADSKEKTKSFTVKKSEPAQEDSFKTRLDDTAHKRKNWIDDASKVNTASKEKIVSDSFKTSEAVTLKKTTVKPLLTKVTDNVKRRVVNKTTTGRKKLTLETVTMIVREILDRLNISRSNTTFGRQLETNKLSHTAVGNISKEILRQNFSRSVAKAVISVLTKGVPSTSRNYTLGKQLWEDYVNNSQQLRFTNNYRPQGQFRDLLEKARYVDKYQQRDRNLQPRKSQDYPSQRVNTQGHTDNGQTVGYTDNRQQPVYRSNQVKPRYRDQLQQDQLQQRYKDQPKQGYKDQFQQVHRNQPEQEYRDQPQKGYKDQFQQVYRNQPEQGYRQQSQQGYRGQSKQGYSNQFQQGYRNQPEQGYKDQSQQAHSDQFQQGYRDQPKHGYKEQPQQTYRDQSPSGYRDQSQQGYRDQSKQGYKDEPRPGYTENRLSAKMDDQQSKYTDDHEPSVFRQNQEQRLRDEQQQRTKDEQKPATYINDQQQSRHKDNTQYKDNRQLPIDREEKQNRQDDGYLQQPMKSDNQQRHHANPLKKRSVGRVKHHWYRDGTQLKFLMDHPEKKRSIEDIKETENTDKEQGQEVKKRSLNEPPPKARTLKEKMKHNKNRKK